jgi:hypothetical protein
MWGPGLISVSPPPVFLSWAQARGAWTASHAEKGRRARKRPARGAAGDLGDGIIFPWIGATWLPMILAVPTNVNKPRASDGGPRPGGLSGPCLAKNGGFVYSTASIFEEGK